MNKPEPAIPGIILQKLKQLKSYVRPPRKGTIAKSFIKKFLPDNPVILEAGAHKGTDTVEMADSWPNGTIHAFEPVPAIYSQLKQNTSHLENVKCYPLALGSRTGPCEMFVSSGASDGSSSVLAPHEHCIIHPDVLYTEKIQVEQVTIDYWIKQNNLSGVDFLWLDLEGNELAALKESSTILPDVTAVYSEVNLVENYKGCALYPAFRNWMADMGFRVQKEAIAWSAGGNVLFVRSR